MEEKIANYPGNRGGFSAAANDLFETYNIRDGGRVKVSERVPQVSLEYLRSGETLTDCLSPL